MYVRVCECGGMIMMPSSSGLLYTTIVYCSNDYDYLSTKPLLIVVGPNCTR